MRISLTIDPDALAVIDEAAEAAGVSRSAWIEKHSRLAALQAQFDRYQPPPEPAGRGEVEHQNRVRRVRARWAEDDASRQDGA